MEGDAFFWIVNVSLWIVWWTPIFYDNRESVDSEMYRLTDVSNKLLWGPVEWFLLKSCFCQSANHMNSSLLSLYRKGNPDAVSSTPEMDQRETAISAPRITSKTCSIPLKIPVRGSEGGWFIDKTPSGKKDGFFMELPDEKSNRKKPVSQVDVFCSERLALWSWKMI